VTQQKREEFEKSFTIDSLDINPNDIKEEEENDDEEKDLSESKGS
jgi:hypothetical protein